MFSLQIPLPKSYIFFAKKLQKFLTFTGDSTGEKLDPYLRMDLAEFAKQRKEGVKQFLSGNYRIKIRNE